MIEKLDLSTFNLSKDSRLLVGVSGGSDSMALLNLLVNSNYSNIFVCHVNYHHRNTSDRDELIVKEYCLNNNINFIKSDYVESKGNFEDQARNYRYNRFSSIYKKYDCEALLLAHQLDDCLETYLFRKLRKSYARHLTMQLEDNVYNMRLIRPLIKFRKHEIEEYCASHSITYGFDETNLDTSIKRNDIRINIISKMSDEEFDNSVKEMILNSASWEAKYKSIINNINNNMIDFDFFKLLDQLDKRIILIELINRNTIKLADNLNSRRIGNIVDSLLSNSNKAICLEDNIYLIKSQNKLKIFIKPDNDKICLIFNNLNDIMKSNHFTEFGNNLDGVYIKNSDYPLTIQYGNKIDKVSFEFGNKTFDKFMMEKGYNNLERRYIRILKNSSGEILLIPGIYKHYLRNNLKNNIYMLK